MTEGHRPESTSQPGAVPTCFRHDDRETYIRCQRCDRPICAECMRQASVGFQCPECVAQGAASVRQPRTMYGGAVRARDNLATVTLIGLNVVMFVVVLGTGGRTSPVLAELVLVTGETPAGFPPRSFGVADGEVWRLVTSAFVHEEVLHILLNMVALWIFGPTLERLLGRWRFVGLYLLGALCGSTAVYLLAGPNTFTYGASGAVFALFGAALLVSVRMRYDVSWLLTLLAVNLVFTFVAPNISWQGHLGGLVGGLVMGAALAFAPRQRRTALQLLAFAAVLALCTVAIVARTLAIGSAA
ncbi:MAG: rhomboid family intramembrane serine protease [Actinomycetota bacterium]|nr:rhomboid family intramembrane serine protease [Actinomycetota bacterium]